MRFRGWPLLAPPAGSRRASQWISYESGEASPEVASDGCTLDCNGSKGPREALNVDRGNASRELGRGGAALAASLKSLQQTRRGWSAEKGDPPRGDVDCRPSLALRHPCYPISPCHPYLPKRRRGQGAVVTISP